MKLPLGLLTILGCIHAILAINAGAQNLPTSLSFTTAGTFTNGTAETSDSLLITDNNLTNGYKSGFDLIDTPATLSPTGPAGSAAFQWGTAASSSASSTYLHPSALWFQPLSVSNAAPEQTFAIAYLYYRNGTISPGSGATAVDIAMTLSFSQPLGIDPISVFLGTDLINTKNTTNQIDSADIVSLRDPIAPLNFYDSQGKRYYMELTFAVDQDTIDNSLSTLDEFRVFEGKQGRATLQARFTTSPIAAIPEPSTTLLGALGAILLVRRRR